MDGGGNVPVARRTRLQVKRRSFPQESSQRISIGKAVKPRRPGKQLSGSRNSTSEEANSEPESERERRPQNAVQDSEIIEFLMIDRDGTNVRKFYVDRMTLETCEIDSGGAGCCKSCQNCVCRRSKTKKNSPVVGFKQGNSSDKKKRLSNKKKRIDEGRTSVFPVVISDDEQDDGEDVGLKVKDLPANKDGDGDVSKGSQETIPPKKRHKFEEQELPGHVEMNSTLSDVNVKPFLEKEGVNQSKEMNTSTPIKTAEIQIQAQTLMAAIKKEMMEASKSLP